MRKLPSRLCALVLVGLLAAPAFATDWPKSDIPPDPAVTFGVLPNGMRYAIQHNATPTGEVSVRLRIQAGSLQEAPDQRGLAHFLEHMAFRGSAHVPDQEIEKMLARLGLRFGADTNAGTGQEETVYQFDMPRSDDATVDTALMLTRDIAGNLNLDPAAAKTEAGVVLSELRLRDLPSFRASQARLDFTIRDPHATQLPNGDPAIVGAVPIQRIRDFYHAYYRPDRATLLVVGDIDPKALEAKIRADFSGWHNDAPAGTDPKIAIPLDRGLEASSYAEAGAPNAIRISWLQPPEHRPSDLAEEKGQLIDAIALRVLNRRFQQAANSPARPFTRAGADFDQDYQAVRIGTLTIGYEPGKWQTALAAAETIRIGALEGGVSQDEVDRAVTELRADFTDRAAGEATRPSREIVNSLLDELSDDEVYTSNSRDLAAFNTDVKGLTAQTVGAALHQVFQGGGPLVFISGEAPVTGGNDTIKAAFLAADQAARAAPQNVAQAAARPWPYTRFGAPGKVVERRQVADLGVTYLRFANGVRLTVRPSKLHANEVQVSVKLGGGRLDLPRDQDTAAWAAGALVQGGLGALSYTDMQRSLAGKNYSAAFGIGDDGFLFTGQTTPGDLDTQMQVLAAYVRDPGFRPESFETFRALYAERLRRSGTSPGAALQLQMAQILHGGDKRWASATAVDVARAKVDDLRALLAPAFAHGAIDVTIVGDISVDQAVAATAATFGAFAPRPLARPVPGADNATRFPAPGAAPVRLRTPEQSDQEVATMVWPTHGRFPDIQDDVTLQLLAAIMEDRLFTRLRGLGTAYVASVDANSDKVFDYGYVQAATQLPPGQVQQFHDALAAIVADLKAGGASADELARARNPALEELRKARQTNDYWLSVLDDTEEHPAKLALVRDYEGALRKVTLADIAAAARKYLTDPSAIRLAAGP